MSQNNEEFLLELYRTGEIKLPVSLTINGVRKTLRGWATYTGLSPKVIKTRYYARNWKDERLIAAKKQWNIRPKINKWPYDLTCKYCESVFTILDSSDQRKKYCSKTCVRKAWLSKNLPEEERHRRMMLRIEKKKEKDPGRFTDMPGEIWVNTASHPAEYEVSNLGRVRRHSNVYQGGTAIPGLIMRPRLNHHGYPYVTIRNECQGYEGKQTSKRVHRLVLEAFVPNVNNKSEVNHKNRNKQDNRIENLEWVTGEENRLHSMGGSNPKNTQKYALLQKIPQKI